MDGVNEVDLRLQDAEERIGVAVGKSTLSLDTLKKDGVLIEVSVRGLSICSRRTTNSERGITDDDVRRKRLTPGVTKTIPAEELSSLEAVQAQIHSNLADSGYVGIGFNPARFITWGAWEDWYSRQTEFEQRWADIVERICVKLPDYVEESQDAFRLIATKSWQAIWSNHDEQVVEVDDVVYRHTPENYAKFEQRIVSEAIARIPTPEIVRSTLTISWSPRIIVTGADYAAEVARLEQAQTAVVQERADQEKARAEAFAAQSEAAAVRQIVAEKLRQQLLSMPDPREGMVLQLRQRLAGVAENTRQSIEDKGRLYRPTSEALAKMGDTFRKMDLGDDDLRTLIEELQIRLDAKTSEGKYNVEAIGETLRKIEALKASGIVRRSTASKTAERIGALEI